MKNVIKIASIISAVMLSVAAISCASTEKEAEYFVVDEDAPEKSSAPAEAALEQVVVEEAAE